MPEETTTRRYTVVTSAGYWGKGNTPEEAAKNAQVTSKPVKGYLYDAIPGIVAEEINVDGYGGTNWKWKPELVEAIEAMPDIIYNNVLQGSTLTQKGTMKRQKGKLFITTEYE